MRKDDPPPDVDSAGVYFMTVEEFEGRSPDERVKPKDPDGDLPDSEGEAGSGS